MKHHVAATSSSTNTSVLNDEEFGDIRYRRVAGSRHIRISLAQDGHLRATLPARAPLKELERFIETSREDIRKFFEKRPAHQYVDGQRIGQSHKLVITAITHGTPSTRIHGQQINVYIPATLPIDAAKAQDMIREQVAKALRVEAKAYLPRRLSYLAEQFGFTYERVRFAHQSGRWGSCSSSGTISLNIALMNLPFELIDYVLVHELSHTRHMNHSPAFWRLVESGYPDYKTARKQLKSQTPYL